MEKDQFLYLNTTALAFMGDAVYESYVRAHILKNGTTAADRLHKEAVAFVRADAQAKALKEMLEDLSEEEYGLVKRARNKRILSKPKNADPIIYKWATAFEALIGYLFLSDQKDRMEDLIIRAIDSTGDENGKEAVKKSIQRQTG